MSPEQAMDDFQMNAHDAYMADIADLEAYRSAFAKPGLMVFLNGRNEHGTHVVPVLPSNVSAEVDLLLQEEENPNEQIMQAAEVLGFGTGDLVWTEWHFNKEVRGDFGRVEAEGYWEFDSINAEATRVLTALPTPPRSGGSNHLPQSNEGRKE